MHTGTKDPENARRALKRLKKQRYPAVPRLVEMRDGLVS